MTENRTTPQGQGPSAPQSQDTTRRNGVQAEIAVGDSITVRCFHFGDFAGVVRAVDSSGIALRTDFLTLHSIPWWNIRSVEASNPICVKEDIE